MQAKITLSGTDRKMVEERDYILAIEAAALVFARHGADPVACEAANQKFCEDAELDHSEALQCGIWEEANHAAVNVATVGWMSREIDLYILVRMER